MSACPDCGRETVPEPCGHEAFCGRRVQFNDVSENWQMRVLMRDRCRAIAAARGLPAIPADWHS